MKGIVLLECDVGSQSSGILTGDAEGFVGDVPGCHLAVSNVEGQRDGNASASRPDIQQIFSLLSPISRLLYHPSAQFLRFRPGNQHTRLHVQPSSTELRHTQHVLYGLALFQSYCQLLQLSLLLSRQCLHTSAVDVEHREAETRFEHPAGDGFCLSLVVVLRQSLPQMVVTHRLRFQSFLTHTFGKITKKDGQTSLFSKNNGISCSFS